MSHPQGYVTDWDLESQIWSQIFGPSLLRITPPDCTLLLTEPLFNPAPLRRQQDQLVFETFGFHSYHRSTAASLALRGYQYEIQSLFGKPCALIVDIGYSFTHVVPMYNYVPVFDKVRRVDVGGKLLSNYLREVVSYRHINMHDDTYLVNDMKEKMCHVSPHYLHDMDEASKPPQAQPPHQAVSAAQPRHHPHRLSHRRRSPLTSTLHHLRLRLRCLLLLPAWG